MENQPLASEEPSPATYKGEITRSFDCPICFQSLAKPGPSLDHFSFGQFSKSLGRLSYLERVRMCEEFGLVDQYLCNGEADNDKIVSTICGHIFHMGCIREWFFTRRFDWNQKCPFCNKGTCYEQCRVLHPISCYHEVEAEGRPATIKESEYSDISCTSSSYPTDNEQSVLDENEDPTHQPRAVAEIQNEATHGHPYEFSSIRAAQNMRALISTIWHLMTLRCVFRVTPILYQIKKEARLFCMNILEEQVEDEQLTHLERNRELSPLGYELIFSLFIFAPFIALFESLLEYFAKKDKGSKNYVWSIGLAVLIISICAWVYSGIDF